MSLPVLLAIGSSVFFGTIVVLFSFWEEKRKKQFKEQEMLKRQHVFELSFLHKLQDNLDGSSQISSVLELLISNLEKLFPHVTAAYILCEETPNTCRLFINEEVGNKYLSILKEQMLSSLNALSLPMQLPIDDKQTGIFINDTDLSIPQSLFTIPLVLKEGKVVGVLTISSADPNSFREKEMDTIYSMVHRSMMLYDRLKHSLNIENNKLAAMIKSLREGAFMVDKENVILVCNDKIRELLSIQKQSPTLLDILNVLPSSINFMQKLERSVNDDTVVEEKNLKIGGKTLEMVITPVSTLNQTIGAAILLHDVTFEKSVAQMKEDFTNIMVHELRSPLSAMKASSQLLIAKDSSFTPDERKKLLSLISEQSQTLLDEVSMILDAAKLQSGLFTVQKIEGNLGKLIDEVITFFTPQAENKYITLRKEVDDNLPEFMFDQRYVALVLNNLLSNSMKFTNVGGNIIVTARKDNNDIILSVTDNGIGIPKDKQATLFTKFTQIATHDQHVGTGLGLYIVKGITDAHGGKIFLDSEPGRGTTITIKLPIVSQPIDKPLPKHSVVNDLRSEPNQTSHLQ